MKCPRCGTEGNGAFCSNCGAELAAVGACRRCGAELLPGARYCVQCGARAGGRAISRYAIPAAIVALALIVGWWLGARGTPRTDASVPAGSPGLTMSPASPGSPPPLTGTLRDQADRLFERIMQARAQGDRDQVEFFLPMALQAYEGVEDLDPDGLFHLGLLQIEAGRTDAAAATAGRIAGRDPDHLFADALAADAALADGDTAAARTALRRLVQRFDAEVARPLPEYRMHRPALDEYRNRAERLGS